MDAAALSLKIDSSSVVQAANDLDKFSAAADRAAKAGSKTSSQPAASAVANVGASAEKSAGSIAKLVASVESANAKLSAITGSLDKIGTAMQTMARAGTAASAANDNVARSTGVADSHVVAYTRHLEMLVVQERQAAAAQAAASAAALESSRSIGSADSHVTAYTQHLAAMAAQAKAAAAAQEAAAAAAAEASRSFGAADAHVLAYAEHLRRLSSIPLPPALPTPPSGGPAGPNPSPSSSRPSGNSFTYYGGSGVEATGQAAQLASHHAQNLLFQLNDVFVSLASGQKPMMVFIQQGAQIGQIYGQTGLSLKGFAIGLASMLRLMTSATAATEAAAFASAQQATASIAGANAMAVANVRAAETNMAIAQTQIAMATTATEAAAAEARLAVAVAALGPAQAEAAITGQALATAQVQQASTASAARAATTSSITGLGIAVAAVAGLLVVAAAGIAALTKQANDDSGLKKYTTAMGYTKEEVKKLNAVTVTFGDTTKAVFQGALASAASAMGMNAKDMAKTWDSFLDYIVSGTRAALAGVYAAIAGTKAYLGEVEKGGVLGLGKMLVGQGDPNLLKNTYGKAYADAQKGMDAIAAQARRNAQKRQTEMAKGFYDKPNVPKGPKTDSEKFEDIVKRAQAEIDVEKARAAAAGLSARAAAELEQSTKLLNDVKKAGIPVTAALTAKVGELAKAYADAKIAADVAVAMEALSDSMKQQSAAIDDQLSLVGLYGDKLTRARIEAESLAKAIAALPKGETLSPDQYNRVVSEAGGVADDQVNLDRVTRGEKLRKDAEDAAYAMDLERKGLRLTGEAAIAYDFAVQRLNENKRAGIETSPDEIAAINAAGAAYAAQRYAIDQQAQAIAEQREVAKGFFTDWINGARQGESVFKSFANSAVSALNKIIDKLLDKTLDGFLNGGMASGGGGSSGGGFFSSLLGSLGIGGSKAGNITPSSVGSKGFVDPRGQLGGMQSWDTGGIKFANGGAFTNTIVNTPTLFRFANGGSLGEMGEAGPEAIMPLKRGPNGSLGVQMHGGGKPVVRMGDYNPSFSFEGAVGLDGIASMVRQGGEATYNQMKRDLQSLLQQIDTDGAIVS